MVSSPEVGEEFCRILLQVILGKEIRKVKIIPQRTILGSDTNKHGVRLDAYVEDVSKDEILGERSMLDAQVVQDIYDFEPDKIYEKDILPKKTRYYHGMIDTKLLDIGVSYKHLPNVYIIVILPYDPFGKNRMVYTVKNQCVEDTSVDYDDGAVKLFLYTRGTEGNPSQNLIDMLKYIEESTEQNIVNQDIQTIHTLVKHMKQKKEVDIHYMKSWEWEEYIREKATKEGKEEGRKEGMKEGRKEGIKEQQKETEQQRKRAEKAEAEVMRLREALEKLQQQ